MQNSLEQDSRLAAIARKALIERFTAEAAFARKLADFEGRDWKKPIREAEAVFAPSLSQAAPVLEQALTEAEGILAPVASVAKTYTIHCIGHGHIDMNWMWGWPETVAVTNDTFLTVLKLMDEFPAFKYTQSQASVYEIMREYNPEAFERIQQRVKEGRWEVVASHWVEGDKNMASGEALTRHLLYTRRFFKENFGLEPEDVAIDWSPDTFGHAWTVPGIDARGAVRYYYLCRGGDAANPPIFWWEGPDGRRLLVYQDLGFYNGAITPHTVDTLLDFCGKSGLKDWMKVYGVGDHGGGPTRRDLRFLEEMNTWPVFPNLRFSTSREYFDVIAPHMDALPVIRRELNFEFSGCYTSQSEIKRNNREGENAVSEAETAAVLAHAAAGREYPAKVLRDAWVNVLFSHFHDILPGSGVAQTRSFNQGTFQRIAAATGMVKTNSLRAVAAAVDTSFPGQTGDDTVPAAQEALGMGGGAGRYTSRGDISSAGHVADGPRPVVVFNPSTWPRNEVVKLTVWDAQTGACPGELKDKSFILRAPDGAVIPTQRTGTGEYWGHDFVDLAFPASAGPLGYTAYSVEEGTVDAPAPAVVMHAGWEGKDHVNLPSGELTMENEFLRVVFDKASGGIVSLVDKRTGRDVADPDRPMGILEYTMERPQTGSAWILGAPARTICPLELTGFGAGAPGAWSTDISANSPYVATVAAHGKVNDSTFTVTYQLKAGQPWVDVTVETRWVERGGPEIGTPRLSIRFPVALTGATALYEIPYGSIERGPDNARDVPALRWADMRNDEAGVAILNDCKYGHSFDGAGMRIALVRSSYEPDPLPEIGDHRVRMAIAPHGPKASAADLIRLGAAFNAPLLAVPTDLHTGPLPSAVTDGVVCDADNVLVTQVKRAEDSEDLVLRLQETSGDPTMANVSLSPVLFGRVDAAVEADLIERPLSDGTAAASGNGFCLKLNRFGIATVKVACSK